MAQHRNAFLVIFLLGLNFKKAWPSNSEKVNHVVASALPTLEEECN